jgi:hypothetical protein
MNELSPNKQQQKKRPAFGLLSLVFPLLGIPIAILISKPASGSSLDSHWGYLSTFLWVAMPSISLGFISACVALIRSEPYRFLPWLGLVANIAPPALFLLDLFLHLQ